MSYKISYGSEKSDQAVHFGLRLQLLTAAFLLVFLLLAHSYWEQGRDVIERCLLSEGGRTYPAAEILVAQLEEGIPFIQALEAFCNALVYAG